MSFKSTLIAGLSTLVLASPALSADIEAHHAYARSASKTAVTGAVFMVLHNFSDTDDHLISVASPAAEKVQLHTHTEDANGIVKMVHVEAGFPLPANGVLEMSRGGNHVMFLGLTDAFEQGESIPLTLTFQEAGDVQINVIVDQDRKSDGGHGHSENGHEEGHSEGHGQSHDQGSD